MWGLCHLPPTVLPSSLNIEVAEVWENRIEPPVAMTGLAVTVVETVFVPASKEPHWA